MQNVNDVVVYIHNLATEKVEITDTDYLTSLEMQF